MGVMGLRKKRRKAVVHHKRSARHHMACDAHSLIAFHFSQQLSVSAVSVRVRRQASATQLYAPIDDRSLYTLYSDIL